MLAASQVVASFQSLDKARVSAGLRGVDLEVKAGEAVAVMGANGAGKSTLLAACGGLIPIKAGRIVLDGRDVSLPRHARWLRARVGIAFQSPERGFFAATVRQELEFTVRRLKWSRDRVDEAVRDALALVGLHESLLDRSPFSLSGGQKRRVALAAAVAHKPGLLLLDEPENGLDAVGKAAVARLVRAHVDRGGAAVVATHDADSALGWADRFVRLREGRVEETIDAAAVVSGERIGGLAPFFSDGGAAFHLQRSASEMGVTLPSPYLDPSRFLEALRTVLVDGGERSGNERARAARADET